MQKQRYDLNELAAELGRTVEDLIRFGSEGELTIHVVADQWSGKKTGDANAVSAVPVNGAVSLLPDDLLRSLNAARTSISANSVQPVI